MRIFGELSSPRGSYLSGVAKSHRQAPSTILGGSLTRSPQGRLQTLQTHGLHTSPSAAQQVWSQMKRRRYPRAWDGKPLSTQGSVIDWSEQVEIACGACRHSLGQYRAYHVRDEEGIVEDTARHYEQAATGARSPGDRAPRSRPRFQIDGEIGGRARKTTARFRCPGCGREYNRNLARLARQLFEHAPGEVFLLQ
jgi:hypothetical protein